jgi:hypothetical protein
VVTAAAPRIELGPGGSGQVGFTVTNVGTAEDHVDLDVVPGDGAQRDWFTVSEPRRRLRPGASDTYLVSVAVPSTAPVGTYSVEARVWSSDRAPEETSRISGRVSFAVATVQPVRRARWPYALAAAVLVLIVALTVGFLLLRRSGSGPSVAAPASPSTTATKASPPAPPCPKCMIPLESPDLQPADCITYDPGTVSVVSNPAGFYVQDRTNKLRLTLDDANAANQALILARSYTQLCAVGQQDPVPGEDVVRYWHQPSGLSTASFEVACLSYDNHMSVTQTAPDIWSAQGRERKQSDGSSDQLGPVKFHRRVDADNFARLASAFNAVCFVGMITGHYVMYWQ